MELSTRANYVTETEDFSTTIVDAAFRQYLDDALNDNIRSASLTPNDHTTTYIINLPPEKRFRVSYSQLTEDRHLIKHYGTHMFQLN